MTSNREVTRNVVCLVVARGGSAGFPRKNVLPILDVPCVERIVNQIHEWCEEVPVVVSTDDEEIKRICHQAGSTIIDRPAELATSDSQVKYTLLHACETMRGWGWDTDYILLREGNTIVVDSTILSRAIETIERVGCDSVLPVVSDPLFDPMLAVDIDSSGYVSSPFMSGEGSSGNRQQRSENWRIWFGAECFRPTNFRRYDDVGPWWYMGKSIIGMSVARSSAIHIDCEADRQLAEFLLSRPVKVI